MIVTASLEERLTELRNKWFLMEPAYFMVLCTHKVELNPNMKCDIAVGSGIIYINEAYFGDKNDKFLEERMKMEVLRILLKHPYQRQLPNRVKMFLSSNFVLANNTKFSEVKLVTTQQYFGTRDHDKSSLEEIYDYITLESPDGKKPDNKKGKGGSGSGNSGKITGNSDNSKMTTDDIEGFDDGCTSVDDAIEKTQYWKEDEYRQVEVNNIIQKIDRSNSWGNIPGNVVDAIKKSIEPKFNYKAIFQQFRSTVLSSNRTLTRMKPNRRFGYDAMGSKRNFTTKILVAIDTSGSISDEDLELALGFINKFFKYGIEEISTIQFDTSINKDSLKKLTKSVPEMKVHGRGGTDFNDVFEYAQKINPVFDGVIILTDGYASVPSAEHLRTNYRNVKYVWCLNNESNWNHFKGQKDFMRFGKCTYVDKKYND